MPDQILTAILSQPWAISPEGLDTVLAVVSRGTINPEALEKVAGRELDNTRAASVRDGVALIPVHGPLLARATMFDAISGATSYSSIVRDLHEASLSSEVRAIVLRISSPGGQVHGCYEAAQIIRDMRGTKPLIAYVEGDACSAAYWLAAACDEIVCAPTAWLGCLGVQLAYEDDSEAMENEGIRRIVITSAQTPDKNLAPTTDAGMQAYNQIAFDAANVFLDSVAELRAVDRARVDEDYGRGKVLVGARAVAAGLADRVSTYEALHAELISGGLRTVGRTTAPAPTGALSTPTPEQPMSKRLPKLAARTSGADASASSGGAGVTAAAFEANTDVRSLVTRDVGVAEGDEGSVVEVRDGTFYSVAFGEGDASTYQWLAEDEIEAVTAPAADTPPTDAPPADNAPAPNAVQRLIASAKLAERTRINGILAFAAKVPIPTLQAMIDDTSCTPQDAAHRLLTGAAKGARSTTLANLAADETELRASTNLSSVDDGTPAQKDNPLVAALRATNPGALAARATTTR